MIGYCLKANEGYDDGYFIKTFDPIEAMRDALTHGRVILKVEVINNKYGKMLWIHTDNCTCEECDPLGC